MRQFSTVLEKIISQVPETETEIRANLQHIHYSSGFKAPELMSDCWQELSRYLNSIIKRPTQPWQVEVVATFIDKTPDEINAMLSS